MKAVTLALAAIAILLAALIGFFFIGGTLRAQAVVLTAEAQQTPEVFETVNEVLAGGIAPQVFDDSPLEDAAQYVLSDVTVTFKNGGLFNAEWLHAQVVPGEGDVAVYSVSDDSLDVAAHSSAQFNLKMISRAGEPGAGRTLEVEYYVLGMRRTVSVAIAD